MSCLAQRQIDSCRSNDESGIALVEFLIAFPFLFVFLIGMFDLGVALNKYYTLNRIAYEGTRYAASLPVLEPNSYPTATSVATAPGHQQVRARVDTLLLRNGINPVLLPTDYLLTARIPSATLGAGYTRDQVRVRIKLPFVALFPLIGNALPFIGADVSGPYLFTN